MGIKSHAIPPASVARFLYLFFFRSAHTEETPRICTSFIYLSILTGLGVYFPSPMMSHARAIAHAHNRGASVSIEHENEGYANVQMHWQWDGRPEQSTVQISH